MVQCLFSSKPLQRQRTLVSETASSYMVSIYIHCICIISVLLLLYVSAVIHFVCYLVWFSRLFRGPGSIEKNFPHKLIVIASSLYAFWLMKGFIGMLCFRQWWKTVYILNMYMYVHTHQKNLHVIHTQKDVLKILEWLSKWQ